MKLFGIRAVVTAAVLGMGAILQGQLYAHDGGHAGLQPNPSEAMNEPHKHAWSLFLAVNHPADLSQVRGTADSKKRIGDPGTVVWETWKLARTEVFLDPATTPEPWETPASSIAKIVDPPKSSVLVAELLRGKQGVGIQLDPGEPTNETRMNKATFDFIRDNGLFSIEGQEKFMRAKMSAGERMSFPIDSVEAKASWRRFTAEEEKPDISGRYYTHRDNNGVLWGLATLHILTKEVPNWFWTSFRQVDGPKPGFPQSDPVGRPPVLNGTVWENYELSGVATEFVDSRGEPIILSDPIIEGGFEHSSCISCHAHAAIRTKVDSVRDEMPFFFGVDGAGQGLTPIGPPGRDTSLPVADQKNMFFDANGGLDFFQQDFVFALRRANSEK
ncbi:MAG: hypothetical protein E5Y73_01990 [Mesorhizobium sp.]|uniref:hypothetical protein n=1 Tax=Mesorhizobium sp. TaxID=1871066 RepID=UPI001203EBC7|nr:hypothetical protein [Mesorhizobium sp.]TIL96301.1 MAG: hypothetical protein E5Y73_01990 [Mesorhizobium sp.]